MAQVNEAGGFKIGDRIRKGGKGVVWVVRSIDVYDRDGKSIVNLDCISTASNRDCLYQPHWQDIRKV